MTKNNLESISKGFTEKEIMVYKSNSVQFPKAYRLFLSLMSKSDLMIFDNQDFSIKGLIDAKEVSNELLKKDNFMLNKNQFVFTQWQGYNFCYFDLEMDNPNVELYIEAGCASKDAPPEIHKYGSLRIGFDYMVNGNYFTKKTPRFIRAGTISNHEK